MKTILVPVDFSETTDAVVEQSAALAAAMASTIVLIHVTAPTVLSAEYGPLVETIIETSAVADRTALKSLERLKTSLAARYLNVECVHRHGAPATEIIDEARRRQADYIVLGSHGHSALFDLLVGSTAHGILKESPCPVVVVPSPRTAKKAVRKRK